MGIPWSEAIRAGSIMATKLITNEFVAKILIIKTVICFLVAVGIMVGAIKGIDSKQEIKVASFALRLLLGATLASIISASIIGLVL